MSPPPTKFYETRKTRAINEDITHATETEWTEFKCQEKDSLLIEKDYVFVHLSREQTLLPRGRE